MKGRILVFVQFACLTVLVLLPGDEPVGILRTTIAGALFMLSAAVLVTAFVNLRESVTVFPEPRADVPFVTHGIYRYVRHPMYLGVLLFALGMTTVKWSMWAAVVLLVLYVDLRIKHQYEDHLLAAKWKHAREYQHRVGALLPRLGRH